VPVAIDTPDHLWRQRLRALTNRVAPSSPAPSDEEWREATVQAEGETLELTRDGNWWTARITSGQRLILAQGVSMESAISRALANVRSHRDRAVPSGETHGQGTQVG
jgi:hypothetical protein